MSNILEKLKITESIETLSKYGVGYKDAIEHTQAGALKTLNPRPFFTQLNYILLFFH